MKRVLSSILFLALLIAIPVIVFLPDEFDKYKVDLIKIVNGFDSIFNTYFVDLNADGQKEKVICFKQAGGNNIALHYFSYDGLLIDQLNFSETYINGLNELYFGDVNKNGYSEIYAFSLTGDSLFLNWFEPFSETNSIQRSKFITRVGTYKVNQFDIIVNELHFYDLTGDGIKDIVFPVGSGYSLTPRNIFIYDANNDSVICSGYFGYNLDNLRFVDLNNDHTLEILADVAASGNLKDSLGRLHIDNRPWLTVLDFALQPIFDPVPFSTGLRNRIYVFTEGKYNQELLVLHFNFSNKLKAEAFLFSTTRKILKRIPIHGIEGNADLQVFQGYNKEIYIFEGTNYCKIDGNLNVSKLFNLTVKEGFTINTLTSFFKNSEDLVLSDNSQQNLILLLDNFKEKVEIPFNEKIHHFTKWNNHGNGEFFVLSDTKEYYFKVGRNWLYFLKYPIFIIIYFASVGFILLIQFIQTRRLREKYELQNQVRDLELKSFQSQMDPHFMFNAFTSMASLLKKGEQEEAYNAFMKFSKMVRVNLENSNQITRTLKEELQVVTDFLELNKMRFKEKLEYSINISDDINDLFLVPKLVLQIHVENALKHGLTKKKGVGKIFVSVKKADDFLEMVVEDNGIGREKAASFNHPSTKKGIKMLDAMYDRLNSVNKNKIKQIFIDLKDEKGAPVGTRVEIKVPVDLKE